MPPRRNSRTDSERKARGREAEQHARRYLEARGLTLLAENYRTRWGEIDLVMEHAGHVVFVEVRARLNNNFGGAAASVTAAKQARLVRAAARFLEQSRLAHRPARFDIVAVDGAGRPATAKTEWITDAFRPAE
ncbi:MAG TPA: YraN family protein [Gammaproteobacteria bacterium]